VTPSLGIDAGARGGHEGKPPAHAEAERHDVAVAARHATHRDFCEI